MHSKQSIANDYINNKKFIVNPALDLGPIWVWKGFCLLMLPLPPVSTLHHWPLTRKKENQCEGELRRPVPWWATTILTSFPAQFWSLGWGSAMGVVTLAAP